MFSVSTVTALPLEAPALPSLALLECLRPKRRASFLRVWTRLPLHLRAVSLDLHGMDWTLEAIEQLGGVLCEFPDVFAKSESDLGVFPLMPFVISVPEGKRSSPIMATEVEATLN